jgi:hypothetical protein
MVVDHDLQRWGHDRSTVGHRRLGEGRDEDRRDHNGAGVTGRLDMEGRAGNNHADESSEQLANPWSVLDVTQDQTATGKIYTPGGRLRNPRAQAVRFSSRVGPARQPPLTDASLLHVLTHQSQSGQRRRGHGASMSVGLRMTPQPPLLERRAPADTAPVRRRPSA